MSSTVESSSAVDAARSKPQRAADLVVTIGFLIAIAAPGAAMLVGGGEADIARTEQRRAAPFPELAVRRVGPIPWLKSSSLQEFPHGFESWFDDRVGFRRELIRGYNLAKVFGLTVENQVALGTEAHGSVTVGRDGWLFLAGGRMEQDFRRTDPFSSADLVAWRRVLAERRERLAAAGIGYALLVAPNQQTIYAEFMPRSMTRAEQPSRLDQLAAEAAREPKLPVVDVRSVLFEGKRKFPTYHRTDTHWNDYGALLAYQAVLDRLGPAFCSSSAAALEAFDVRVERVVNYGDMVRALNAPIDYEQQLVTLAPRTPRHAVCEPLDAASTSPRYKSTNYAVPAGRLLVFHDSFMESLRPYFNEHFREVYYYRGFSVEAIAELKPDFVLEEMAERFLMLPVPTNSPSLQTFPPADATTIAREPSASPTRR